MNLPLAIAIFAGVTALSAATFNVTPSRVLVDEQPVIEAGGLEPGEHVTIRAELLDGADQQWSSKADFVADEKGVVDVSKQAPVAGSYKIVSALGLVWSMMPETKDVKIYQAPKKLASQKIHFELQRKSGQPAGADLEQLPMADGVREVEVKGALHGVLFVPAAKERRPGVLVLGGSEGGAPLRRAAWLASHGYVALALAYFRYEDLPPRLEAIPLEYFGKAIAWMMQRPEIVPEKIAVLGASRGGELALQLGSIYPEIKTVVAYVPSNVRNPACCGDTSVPYAWTVGGRPAAYMPLRRGRGMEFERAAEIAVEQTAGPILVIAGEDDGVWESSRMVDAIIGRLKLAHFAFRYESLKYQHAGHRAGHEAITPEWHAAIRHPVSGREVHWGGKPEGNALSAIDASPKVLAFLRESLGEPSPH